MTDSEKVIPKRYDLAYYDVSTEPIPSRTWAWDTERFSQMCSFAKRLIEELGAAEASLAMLEGALTCKNETVIELSAQQEAMRMALEAMMDKFDCYCFLQAPGLTTNPELYHYGECPMITARAALSPQAAATQEAQNG